MSWFPSAALISCLLEQTKYKVINYYIHETDYNIFRKHLQNSLKFHLR